MERRLDLADHSGVLIGDLRIDRYGLLGAERPDKDGDGERNLRGASKAIDSGGERPLGVQERHGEAEGGVGLLLVLLERGRFGDRLL